MNLFTDQNIVDRSIKRLFIFSCLGHLGLVIFFFVGEKLNLISLSVLEKENIRLAQASVRVDVVAMPKFTIKELKAMAEQEEVAPAPSEDNNVAKVEEEKDKGDEYLQEKKKQDFMSMLKDISKKKVDQVKAPKKKVGKLLDRNSIGHGNPNSLGKAARGRLDKLVLAGNQLSTGTALVGEGSTELQSTLDRYASSLPDFVRPRWKLPSYLLNKDLTCRLKLFLSQNGELLKVEIYESSGDSEYDARALQAVNGSAPFPALPTEIKNFGSRGAIVLGFPL